MNDKAQADLWAEQNKRRDDLKMTVHRSFTTELDAAKKVMATKPLDSCFTTEHFTDRPVDDRPDRWLDELQAELEAMCEKLGHDWTDDLSVAVLDIYPAIVTTKCLRCGRRGHRNSPDILGLGTWTN